MPQAPGSSQAAWNRQAALNRCASSPTATSPSPTAHTSRPRNTSAASGSSSAPTWTKRWPGDAKPSSPAGFLSRCERSSESDRIENDLATETRNEKTQSFRAHLAGRRNPGSWQTNHRRNSMRFMMMVIPEGYGSPAPDAVPTAVAVAKMMEYNRSLQKAGVLLALDGLFPPSTGARISYKDGKPTVTDGPFAESKEVIGGYWIIQVRSREEAIEWAKRAANPHNKDERIPH